MRSCQCAHRGLGRSSVGSWQISDGESWARAGSPPQWPARWEAGSTLVAVGSSRPDAVAEFAREWDVPHAVASHRAVASHPDVDVVYVATTNDLHRQNVLDCVEAGKAGPLREAAGAECTSSRRDARSRPSRGSARHRGDVDAVPAVPRHGRRVDCRWSDRQDPDGCRIVLPCASHRYITSLGEPRTRGWFPCSISGSIP